jgi:hypothetical protein
MSILAYDKGDVLGITGTYRNAAGTLIDPSVPKFSFKNPDGEITTYTYPDDAQLQRISQGIYKVDLPFSASGSWLVRHWSTGTGAASEERQYLVRESVF